MDDLISIMTPFFYSPPHTAQKAQTTEPPHPHNSYQHCSTPLQNTYEKLYSTHTPPSIRYSASSTQHTAFRNSVFTEHEHAGSKNSRSYNTKSSDNKNSRSRTTSSADNDRTASNAYRRHRPFLPRGSSITSRLSRSIPANPRFICEFRQWIRYGVTISN